MLAAVSLCLVGMVSVVACSGAPGEEPAPVLPETVWFNGGPPDGPYEDHPIVQAIRAQEYWQNMAWNTGDFELPEYAKLTRDGEFALDKKTAFRGATEGERFVFVGPRSMYPLKVTDIVPGESAVVVQCMLEDIDETESIACPGETITSLAYAGVLPGHRTSVAAYEWTLNGDGSLSSQPEPIPSDVPGTSYPGGGQCDPTLIPIGLYEPAPVPPAGKAS